jgi:DNA repair protein RecN (Recombination protein N)
MLLRLIVRDFVIVDRIELEFGGGFGALTGETGAGKSILVDALSLALGERADASVVRTGAERAEISAEFDVAPGSPWNPGCARATSTDACLLRRVIDSAGRSRGYINGAAATLGQLREVADFSPTSTARTPIIRCCAPMPSASCSIRMPGRRRWRGRWRPPGRHGAPHAKPARRPKRMSRPRQRERELLEWQVGSWSPWFRRRRLAGNRTGAAPPGQCQCAAGRRRHGAGGAGGGRGGEPAAAAACRGPKLAELTSFDPALGEAAQLFEGALIQLEESALALRRYQDRLELDPARLAELDSRIDAVTQMARKHRVAPEELPACWNGCKADSPNWSLRADPAALAERERKAEAAFREVAKKLSALRAKTAKACPPPSPPACRNWPWPADASRSR